MVDMNTAEYWDDEQLPADERVSAFVLSDFDAHIDRAASRAGRSNGVPANVASYGDTFYGQSSTYPPVPAREAHLRTCDQRAARDLAAISASKCGEGTCDYDPSIEALIGCPHGKAIRWRVEADTMGELIDRIAALSSA